MKKEKLPIKQLLSLIIGEIIVSLAVCGIYLLINKFSYKVISGVLLGSIVTVLNFMVLALMTNRVINSFLLERGGADMPEEEALAIAAKFQVKVQNQIKISFLVRTFVMLATLIVAFILDFFDVIATIVPILAFRPIITISELIGRKKLDPAPFYSDDFRDLGTDSEEDETLDELQEACEPASYDDCKDD